MKSKSFLEKEQRVNCVGLEFPAWVRPWRAWLRLRDAQTRKRAALTDAQQLDPLIFHLIRLFQYLMSQNKHTAQNIVCFNKPDALD